jgi:tetratricopeptide (TPR) repeat protein
VVSKEVEALLGKAVTCIEKKNLEESIKLLQAAISIDPRVEESWALLINNYMALRNYSEAIVQCDKALQFFPKDIRFWSDKGDSLLKLDRLDEALQSVERGIKINSKNDYLWAIRGMIFKKYSKIDALKISVGQFNKKKVDKELDEAYKCFDTSLKIKENPVIRKLRDEITTLKAGVNAIMNIKFK